MAGSDAEERVRAKAVVALRAKYPQARIIHELKLDYGNVRIDIAAVTPNRIVTVEVKSERDNLKRLGPQMLAASSVSHEWWLVMNGAQFPRLEAALSAGNYDRIRDDLKRLVDAHRSKISPIDGLEGRAVRDAYHLTESPDLSSLLPVNTYYREPSLWAYRGGPSDFLNLLWAEEYRDICRRYMIKVGKASPIHECRQRVVSGLTGAQIVAEVCRALRVRPFARADDPVISEVAA